MNAHGINIRQVNTDEIDQIEALWNELKQHHQARTIDYTQHYLQTTFDKRKAELLAKERVAIFVAEGQAQSVGFCVVSINGRQGEVDSLFVSPECRGHNTGQALMAAGTAWLKGFDLASIRLSVGQGNESVLRFYEKLGFRTRATLMELID